MPEGTTTVMTPARAIESYIALRAKIHEIEEAHKKQLAPYKDMLGRLEGVLMAELERTGLDSLKGAAGTVFKSTSTSVTVQDWTQTWGYIKDNQLWDLLEARVSKNTALAVIEEKGMPIPGVQVSQATALRVRRA